MNQRSGKVGAAAAARLVAGFALALLLGACATGPRLLHTEVTTYNEWSTLPADKTYVFSRTLEYQGSLELKSYEDIVRDELALQGFRLAADGAPANLAVTLRPSQTTTRIQVRDPWPVDPFGSPFGFYGRRGYGGYDPYWSFYNDFGSYTSDVFHLRLELDIDSKAVPGRRYYEGRVETSSQSGSMKAVMPSLVRALFTDFPGNNGQTRVVDVPIERK